VVLVFVLWRKFSGKSSQRTSIALRYITEEIIRKGKEKREGERGRKRRGEKGGKKGGKWRRKEGKGGKGREEEGMVPDQNSSGKSPKFSKQGIPCIAKGRGTEEGRGSDRGRDIPPAIFRCCCHPQNDQNRFYVGCRFWQPVLARQI
jgi:hypothetical protein